MTPFRIILAALFLSSGITRAGGPTDAIVRFESSAPPVGNGIPGAVGTPGGTADVPIEVYLDTSKLIQGWTLELVVTRTASPDVADDGSSVFIQSTTEGTLSDETTATMPGLRDPSLGSESITSFVDEEGRSHLTFAIDLASDGSVSLPVASDQPVLKTVLRLPVPASGIINYWQITGNANAALSSIVPPGPVSSYQDTFQIIGAGDGSFATFIANSGLTGADADFEADPNGDGFTNGEAWVFGYPNGNVRATKINQFTAGPVSYQPNFSLITFQFLVHEAAVADSSVSLIMEESPDLVNWEVVTPIKSGSGGVPGMDSRFTQHSVAPGKPERFARFRMQKN